MELATRRPVVGQALWLDTLIDASIFREWTANIGRRNAQERTAHLLLEMAARLEVIGEVDEDRFDLPLTQAAMAEALGLSLVHMNKSLQALRRAGYLSIQHRTVTLHDRTAMVALSGFDAGYLHLGRDLIKSLRVANQSPLPMT